MPPENLVKFIENNEELKELYDKLEATMSSHYIYPSAKTSILTIMAEMIEATYIKGRLDERYVNKGPQVSLYER
jgi:predicted regulator of amino acid metabolism with ACT domain